MKRNVLLLLSCLSTAFMFGQLKINESGDVKVGETNDDLYKMFIYDPDGGRGFRIESKGMTSGSSYAGVFYNSTSENAGRLYGLSSSVKVTNQASYFRGIFSSAYTSTPQSGGRSYGVCGKAGNCTSGYNYGVYGTLYGSNNGAGIYGTVNDGHHAIDGKYAGYFYGDVKVTGDCYAVSFVPSDATLKTDIKKIEKQTSKLTQLNGYTYKYNKGLFGSSNDTESVGTMSVSASNDTLVSSEDLSENKMLTRINYGLLAQEVKEIYPELVSTMPNGKLAINYDGFIPVLIEATNEQQNLIDSYQADVEAVQSLLGISEQSTLASNMSNTFSRDYDLKSIYSVASYVKKNSELPDMPSVSDIENGDVSLLEMNAKLLQKVEELTLYMIAQQKEIDTLKKSIK